MRYDDLPESGNVEDRREEGGGGGGFSGGGFPIGGGGLGIGTIVVPSTATAHSAYGAVSSDQYRAFQLSDPQRTPPHSRQASEPVGTTSRVPPGTSTRAASAMAAAGE